MKAEYNEILQNLTCYKAGFYSLLECGEREWTKRKIEITIFLTARYGRLGWRI
jgi:hypothetical protein